MIDVYGDLFEYSASAIAITTNGFVRKDGRAVMGAGCAKEAADLWPGLPLAVGASIIANGNHVFCFKNWVGMKDLITFPVKHHWHQPADLALIERSCKEAMEAADREDWEICVVPRPGCGNGQLSYDIVGPFIAGILDDRFHIITWEETP
jgi:hypothetical protein